MAELTDGQATRMALAGMVAALAAALQKQGKIAPEEFEGALQALYYKAQDAEGSSVSVREALTWTRELFRELTL